MKRVTYVPYIIYNATSLSAFSALYVRIFSHKRFQCVYLYDAKLLLFIELKKHFAEYFLFFKCYLALRTDFIRTFAK